MYDRNTPNHTHAIRPRGIDPQWLRDQLVCVIEWALDIAARLALRDQDDVDAIERVRDFVQLYVAGRRAEVPLRDALTAVGILMSRIHLEDEGTVSVLAPLATMREMPSELPAMLRARDVVALDAQDGNGAADHEFGDEPNGGDHDDDDDDPDDVDDDGPDDDGDDDDRDDEHDNVGYDNAPDDAGDDDVVVADAPDDVDEPDSIPPWRHLAGW